MVYDVDQTKLIFATADALKKVKAISPPLWAKFVKTGAHKERPPEQADWWYVRAAAILRTVAMRGPIGVSNLRTKYGGRKNRGANTDKFVRGSGSIARKILQQLEAAGLVRHTEKNVHKGRVITPAGTKLLSQSAKVAK